MARKSAPAQATEAAAPVETAQVETPAETTSPVVETPAPAETVTFDVPGVGAVQIPTDQVLKAAKSVAPAKSTNKPALPVEAWKLLAAYRRYSDALTYVVSLKDEEAIAGGMPAPIEMAPGLRLEWAAVCDTHTQVQHHRSKGGAAYAAADSMLWCPGCKANVETYAVRATEAAKKATAENATEDPTGDAATE